MALRFQPDSPLARLALAGRRWTTIAAGVAEGRVDQAAAADQAAGSEYSF
jgi:hypothetical protein